MDSPGVQKALKEAGWLGEEQHVSLKGVGGTTHPAGPTHPQPGREPVVTESPRLQLLPAVDISDGGAVQLQQGVAGS